MRHSQIDRWARELQPDLEHDIADDTFLDDLHLDADELPDYDDDYQRARPKQ